MSEYDASNGRKVLVRGTCDIDDSERLFEVYVAPYLNNRRIAEEAFNAASDEAYPLDNRFHFAVVSIEDDETMKERFWELEDEDG